MLSNLFLASAATLLVAADPLSLPESEEFPSEYCGNRCSRLEYCGIFPCEPNGPRCNPYTCLERIPPPPPLGECPPCPSGQICDAIAGSKLKVCRKPRILRCEKPCSKGKVCQWVADTMYSRRWPPLEMAQCVPIHEKWCKKKCPKGQSCQVSPITTLQFPPPPPTFICLPDGPDPKPDPKPVNKCGRKCGRNEECRLAPFQTHVWPPRPFYTCQPKRSNPFPFPIDACRGKCADNEKCTVILKPQQYVCKSKCLRECKDDEVCAESPSNSFAWRPQYTCQKKGGPKETCDEPCPEGETCQKIGVIDGTNPRGIFGCAPELTCDNPPCEVV